MSHTSTLFPVGALRTWAIVIAGLVLSVVSLAVTSICLIEGLKPWWLPVPALALAGGVLLFLRTDLALLFIAFSAAPLGMLTVEAGGITFNVCELAILVTFTKELASFFAGHEKPSSQVPYIPLALLLYAYSVALAVGIARDTPFIRALQDLRQFSEYILLFLLVVHRAKEVGQIRRMTTAFVMGGTLIAIHGVVQHFTGIGIPLKQLFDDAIVYGGTRSGSFYGATAFGGLMVLTVGAATGLLLGARNPGARFLLGGCVAVCVLAAIYSNTRASWISMLAAFVFIGMFANKSRQFLLWTVAGIAVIGVTFGPHLLERLSELEISKSERSLYERLRFYTAAWHIFRAHPLLGLGWGSYFYTNEILANGGYVDSVFVPQRWDSTSVTVHSAYLQVLVKTGLLGFLPFLYLLYSLVRRALRGLRRELRDSSERRLLCGLLAGFVGHLIHIGFENFFQWPVMSQSFWLVIGLSVAMSTHAASEVDQSRV